MTLEDMTEDELAQIKKSFEKMAGRDLAAAREPAATADKA